jgi:hypothetical protein
MSTISHNDTKSPELQAFIIEPVLSCCLCSVSFNFLLKAIQKRFQISCHDLKIYLFYMIEYDVLSYNGQKQSYEIEEGGLNLLSMIKKEKTQGKVNIKDITIRFE